MHALPTTVSVCPRAAIVTQPVAAVELSDEKERKRQGGGSTKRRDVTPLTKDRGRVCAMRVDPEIAFVHGVTGDGTWGEKRFTCDLADQVSKQAPSLRIRRADGVATFRLRLPLAITRLTTRSYVVVLCIPGRDAGTGTGRCLCFVGFADGL